MELERICEDLMETVENTHENSTLDREGDSEESFEDETQTGEGDMMIYRCKRRVKFKRTNLIRSKARIWFLMLCLSLDLVPKTLAPSNKDPKERELDYTEEMREEWRKIQKESGRQFVKLAKRREEVKLKRKEEEGWGEVYENGTSGAGFEVTRYSRPY